MVMTNDGVVGCDDGGGGGDVSLSSELAGTVSLYLYLRTQP